MAACKSCDAPVVFVRMKKKDGTLGARNPLDAAPVEGGNVVLTGTRLGNGTPIARVVAAGEGTHVSHFTTCPNSKQHRRRS